MIRTVEIAAEDSASPAVVDAAAAKRAAKAAAERARRARIKAGLDAPRYANAVGPALAEADAIAEAEFEVTAVDPAIAVEYAQKAVVTDEQIARITVCPPVRMFRDAEARRAKIAELAEQNLARRDNSAIKPKTKRKTPAEKFAEIDAAYSARVAKAKSAKAEKPAKAAKAAPAQRKPADGGKTKNEIMLDMVCAKSGATEQEICDVIGWKACLVTLKRAAEKASVKLRVEKVKGEKARYFGTRPN